MNFSSPQKVLQCLRTGDVVEYRRGQNRNKITTSANGAPPLDTETAKKLGIQINVNWGELASLLAHARRQYYNSFLRGTKFFRVQIPLAPEDVRADYQRVISDQINRPLKNREKFFNLHQYRWTDVVVHGPSTVLWPNKNSWCPDFVAREDLRIPTDTTTDLENLSWFGVRYLYTIGELVNKVFSEDSDRCWNRKAVKSILATYKNVNYDTPQTYIDWETQPEKMAELVKQNLGYYESDAVPKVPIWSFYFKDTNDKWYLRCVPDTQATRGTPAYDEKFLYTTDEPCADKLSELIHCQFGDLNFKTPFMFHSVRSLGFELLEPTYWTNLTRCRFLQHVHENFNRWLQITDPQGKERAQSIEFSGPNVKIPPGVHILAQNERHQIDPEMVEMALAQLKQLMQEASATYTQDVDTGTQKEQTAFETGVKVQQVNAMLSGLMLVALTKENFFYREICRRFCIRNSDDKDVQEFQRMVINKEGIPRKYLDVKYWDIEVDAPLGAGNPTMEMVEASKAIELSREATPTGRQEMIHDAFTVFFGAKRAQRWAPVAGKRVITDAMTQARADFGVLMWGIEVPIRDELNAIEQIDVLLNNLSQVVARVKQEENGVPQIVELKGMATVSEHIKLLIQRIEVNPNDKQLATSLAHVLSRLDNDIKAFGQRLQQKMQKEAQSQNGEHAAKSRAVLMDAGNRMKIKSAEAQQNMQIRAMEFQAEQQRANAKTASEIQRNRLRSMESE